MNKPNILTDRPGEPVIGGSSSKPLWGHPILTPEGIEIRLPQHAFERLKLLGLLMPRPSLNRFQISPKIDAFMDSDCDPLMGALRRILGKELEGPEYILCECVACLRLKEEADKTPKPRQPEKAKRGRYWLKVIRAPRHASSADRN